MNITFTQEAKNLLPAIQDNLQTLHEIYLLETNGVYRETIKLISESLEMLHSAVNGRILHQKHHLEIREIFNKAQVMISTLPEETRAEKQAALDKVTLELNKLDATCHSEWENFASNVLKFVENTEDTVRITLEGLGGKL